MYFPSLSVVGSLLSDRKETIFSLISYFFLTPLCVYNQRSNQILLEFLKLSILVIQNQYICIYINGAFWGELLMLPPLIAAQAFPTFPVVVIFSLSSIVSQSLFPGKKVLQI